MTERVTEQDWEVENNENEENEDAETENRTEDKEREISVMYTSPATYILHCLAPASDIHRPIIN